MSLHEQIARHPCALTPAGADADFCRHYSRLLHNKERCQGCESSWRICTKCVANQMVTDRSVVRDPDSGLCGDHATLEPGDAAGTSDRDRMMRLLNKNGSQVVSVPVSKIRPRPDQPRQYFNDVELENLAASLREVGQIEAVIVVPIEEDKAGHIYELDDGERRWRASKLANIDTLNVIVVSEHLDDGLRFLRSSVANFNREGHTLLERVDMIVRLVDEEGFSQSAIARALGKHPVWVNQHYSLRRLHADVRARLEVDAPPNERLSFVAAQRLAPLQHDLQLAAAPGMVGAVAQEHANVITRAANTRGMLYERRTRAPSDDFRSIVRHVKTAADRLTALCRVTEVDWNNAFRHQVPDNVTALAEQVQRLEEVSTMALSRLTTELQSGD